jgi:hypothetical protein
MEYAQAISQIGFPISMCLLLLKRMQEQDNLYRENEGKLRDVIERNTLAITKLLREGDVNE